MGILSTTLSKINIEIYQSASVIQELGEPEGMSTSLIKLSEWLTLSM